MGLGDGDAVGGWVGVGLGVGEGVEEGDGDRHRFDDTRAVTLLPLSVQVSDLSEGNRTRTWSAIWGAEKLVPWPQSTPLPLAVQPRAGPTKVFRGPMAIRLSEPTKPKRAR